MLNKTVKFQDLPEVKALNIFEQFILNLRVSNYDAALQIANDPSLNVHQINDEEMRPIDYAAFFGQTEIVKTLLNRGAQPNHPAHKRGSPIVYAAIHKDKEMLKALMSFGATFYHVLSDSIKIVGCDKDNFNQPDRNVQLRIQYKTRIRNLKTSPERIAYQHMQKTHLTNIEEYKKMELTDEVLSIIEEALKDRDFVKRLESWKDNAQHSK